MAYLKLYNIESNEIRMLRSSIEFDDMVAFVRDHFCISCPTFKFTDEEGDLITFSTNEELIFLKDLAKVNGWDRIKINVEANKRSSTCKNGSNQEIRQENEFKEPIDFLRLIEQNAPAFFSSLGIECTTYREEVEIPQPVENNSQRNSFEFESKIEKDSMVEVSPGLTIDSKVFSIKEESIPKQNESIISDKIGEQKVIIEESSTKESQISEMSDVDHENDEYQYENDQHENDNDENEYDTIQNDQNDTKQNDTDQNNNQTSLEQKLEESNATPPFEYEIQFVEICGMGFEDIEEVKRCLILSKGIVDDALDMLFQ